MKELIAKNLEIKSHENRYGLTIEQKQSRELKALVTKDIVETLTATYDIDIAMTCEGVYLLIPNENEGIIPVVLDIKMKPLDTDIDTLTEEFQKKIEEKKAKAEKKKATS